MSAPPRGRVLVIAGSDSGGGAGLQADIKAITVLGGFAATAVTAITVQNTLGVSGVLALSPDLIEAQARGLPGVALAAQGVRECLVPDRTGIVIPRGDHEGFRAALLRLIGEPAAARAARSDEAREYARATFDPARQVAAYLELFGRLRAPGGPRP